MSLSEWPEGVQHRPLRNAFRLAEPHVPPHETEFEAGAPRRRPRATIQRALYAFAWDWEAAEFALFQTFYHRTLGEGAVRFTMPVFGTGAYATRTCQFKGMYEASQPNRFWRVSAQIYVYGGL